MIFLINSTIFLPLQTEFGYFLSRGGTVLLRQNGVFRTNCIDCLDRTNVVQSLLAKLQLNAALKLLAVINEDTVGTQFETLFNNVSINKEVATKYYGLCFFFLYV